MKTSQRGLDLIARFEGCRLKVYKDIAGKDTIGIGHLVKPGEDFSEGITREQAEQLLIKDVRSAEETVNKYVTVTLTQSQFDALVSFVFNIGPNAFIASTLLLWLNDERYWDIPQQLTRWIKATVNERKISVKDLARRRVAEAELFLED